MSNVHPLNGPGWTTTDPTEYDPDKKYTAASDNKGHSGWVKNLRVPSDVVGQVAAIVEAGFYDEYNTQGALVRDALHHHLEKLNNEIQSKNLKRVLSLNRLNSMVQQRRDEALMYTQAVQGIREEVTHLVSVGSLAAAKAFIAEMRGMEDAIPEHFREDFDSELKKMLVWANQPM